MTDDKLIETFNIALCTAYKKGLGAIQFDTESRNRVAKELIDLARGSDRELLKIAYGELQESSTAYDNGCNIIRQILGSSPPTNKGESK